MISQSSWTVKTLARKSAFILIGIAGWIPLPVVAQCPVGWTFINPSPVVGDNFGHSVAISGTNALVGTPYDATGASNAGSAYLFDTTSGSTHQTFNDPTPSAGDFFGWSVAISGNNALIGAWGKNTGAGIAYLFSASTGALLQTFNNPAPADDDAFGWSVAIDGNNVLIGAPFKDIGATDTGRAYLFDATTGNLLQSFVNPAGVAYDKFGSSVAISGNNVLVGSPYNDTGGTDSGVAYLFESVSGSLLQSFANPTPVAYDYFGAAVAISGNNALIGSYQDDTGATDAGTAYLFDATSGSLLRTFNNPTSQAYDNFAYSVSISGNNVLIGARYDDGLATNAGSAYEFDATTGALINAFHNPTPVAYDYFGWSVAISGTNVLVGAPNDDTGATDSGSAYFYSAASCATPTPTRSATPTPTRTASRTASPTPTATPCSLSQTINNPSPAATDNFGGSVSISGNRALIGAPHDNTGASDAGSAYLYNASTGGLIRTFNDPTATASDLFGAAVAIEGTNALVGAIGVDNGASASGAAYLIDATSGTVIQTFSNPVPSANALFGSSVAISGNYVLVGCPFDDTGATDAGGAYLFNSATGALLQTFNNPTPATGDQFGYSVAISGNNVVIGAPYDDTGATNAGSVYLFNASTGALLLTFNSQVTNFGFAVAVSGNNVVVGGPSYYGYTAYLFDASTGSGSQTFYQPNPNVTDLFGWSVAISGNNVLVGAIGVDSGVADSGAAFLYDALTGSLLQTFNNPTPATGDNFGASVAISGSNVIIGAYQDDTGATDSGSAYLFGCAVVTPSPTPTRTPTPTATRTATPTPSSTITPTPTPFDNASIVYHTIPAQLNTNQEMTVGLRVWNTGNTTWGSAGLYDLKVTTDSCNLFAGVIHLDIVSGLNVLPGDFYMFSGVMRAPVAPSAGCSLRFDMEDNSVPFGSPLNLSVDVVTPTPTPNRARDWTIYE